MDLLYRNNAYISLTAWIIEFLSSHYLEAVHIEHYNSRLNKAQRVWTIDDPLKMKKLFAAPYVTGLITNRFEEAMDMRALVEQGSGATVWS